MTEPSRKALWDAWVRWWQRAQALGLEVEPIRFDAGNAEILRRGRELRRRVEEAKRA